MSTPLHVILHGGTATVQIPRNRITGSKTMCICIFNRYSPIPYIDYFFKSTCLPAMCEVVHVPLPSPTQWIIKLFGLCPSDRRKWKIHFFSCLRLPDMKL